MLSGHAHRACLSRLAFFVFVVVTLELRADGADRKTRDWQVAHHDEGTQESWNAEIPNLAYMVLGYLHVDRNLYSACVLLCISSLISSANL